MQLQVVGLKFENIPAIKPDDLVRKKIVAL